MSVPAKPDRRTALTKTIIRDAFLEELSVMPFEKVTVARVCRGAGIPRSTFYIHYSGLTDVVDELIDMALNVAERVKKDPIHSMYQMIQVISSSNDVEFLKRHNNLLPACQNVTDDLKFKPLFLDNELSPYVTKRIYLAEKENMVPEISSYCGISETEAEIVFRTILNGVYSMNQTLGWEKNLEWYKRQETLLRMIIGAFNTLAVHNGQKNIYRAT